MTAASHEVTAQPSVERPRVLLVDDEPRVLDALGRALRRSYTTVCAANGSDGIAALHQGKFAVIVSDMRMPGMNGAKFLAEARRIDRDAVRILLTGEADLAAAAAAVNEGEIFRFLRKPCPPETLDAALSAAAERHRSITAERVLLEKTLSGSIKVLTDVLALACPVAFSRALRIKRIVSALVDALQVPERWPVEVAALVSQLGAITVATATLERAYHGEALDADEKIAMASVSTVTEQLIRNIPRLDPVREILHRQSEPFGATLPMGARIFRVALDYDILECAQNEPGRCIELMRGRIGAYDPAVLAALPDWSRPDETIGEVRELRLADVRAGMIFLHDVVAMNGLILIGRGQEATPSVVQRIRNSWTGLQLKQLAQVSVPHTVHGS